MRGTRYGDFSRPTPDPRTADYRAVLMQQGRVQLDADWNAQAARHERELERAIADALGDHRASAAKPGYEIRPRLALEFAGQGVLEVDDAQGIDLTEEHTLELWLAWDGGAGTLFDCTGPGGGSGSYTVIVEDDGRITCRLSLGTLERDIVLGTTRSLTAGAETHVAIRFGDESLTAFLDADQVAQASVPGRSTFDAPRIAIGGPLDPYQTPGFRGTIGAIRLWSTARTPAELAAAVEQRHEVESADELIAWWPLDDDGGVAVDVASGYIARLGGEDPPRWRILDLSVEPGAYYVGGVRCELAQRLSYRAQTAAHRHALPQHGRHVAYLELWEETVMATQDPALREPALGGADTVVRTRIAQAIRLEPIGDQTPQRAVTDLLERTTGALAAEHHGEIAPGNYLYRIEVHEDGDLRSEQTTEARPSFKWSRRNGAHTFAISPHEEGSRQVDVRPGGLLAGELSPGDVVEQLDDAAVDGGAPALARVTEAHDASGRVALDDVLPGTVGERPYLRRWDQRPGPGEGAALPIRQGWIDVEDGIRVAFAPGHYRRGDYWWLLAREDGDSIQWPTSHGQPLPMPPDGIERRTVPLALIDLSEGIVVEDLRRLTEPRERGRPERDDDGSPALTRYDPEAGWGRPAQGEGDPAMRPGRDGAWPANDARAEAGSRQPRTDPSTRPRWRLAGVLDLPVSKLRGLVSTGDTLLITTEDAVWSVYTESGAMTRIAEVPQPRAGFAVALVEDLLLLIGGRVLGGKPDGKVLGLHLDTGQWSERASTAKHAHTAAATVGDHVHVASRRHRRRRPKHRAYHPATDTWKKSRKRLKRTHGHPALAAARGRLHIVAPRAHQSVGLHDGSLRSEPAHAGAQPVLGCASHRGTHVVLVDDHDAQQPQAAIAYHPATSLWAGLPPLPERLGDPRVAEHAGIVVVVGWHVAGGLAVYGLAVAGDDEAPDGLGPREPAM